MRAVDLIRKKRDGHELSDAELALFVREATALKDWETYQLTAMLMAICCRGMTPAETATLTRLMTDSGQRLDLSDIPGPKVDKHSTGGVGDKTSLILAPLAAACGVLVPMMSGRALGHTGGTLDKLESIPGFRVHLSEQEFRQVLRTIGLGMIGQSDRIAPADKTLYALRDVTATVESIPLITASILSKKIASGIGGLVLDVKCGRGAFMKNEDEARRLARSLVDVARANGLACEALLTAMDVPLGHAVGNANEVIESLETLKGRGPPDLEELSVVLAARMVRLAGLAGTDQEAFAKVREALTSGAGVEKFRQMVEQQGGDPRIVDDYRLLPTAPRQWVLTAQQAGYVADVNAETVGRAAMLLGAGRSKAADRIDPSVGVWLRARPGQALQAGDAVMEVHYRDESRMKDVTPMLAGAYTLTDRLPEASPLIRETIS